MRKVSRIEGNSSISEFWGSIQKSMTDCRNHHCHTSTKLKIHNFEDRFKAFWKIKSIRLAQKGSVNHIPSLKPSSLENTLFTAEFGQNPVSNFQICRGMFRQCDGDKCLSILAFLIFSWKLWRCFRSFNFELRQYFNIRLLLDCSYTPRARTKKYESDPNRVFG